MTSQQTIANFDFHRLYRLKKDYLNQLIKKKRNNQLNYGLNGIEMDQTRPLMNY